MILICQKFIMRHFMTASKRILTTGTDSFILLTNTFNDTYNYMADNDQQTLALLVVGGAWVEGMYLTTNVSEAAYNVAGISKVLLEQKKSFDLFLDLTKPYMDDPMIRDFVKELDPIKKVYAGLGTSLTDRII